MDNQRITAVRDTYTGKTVGAKPGILHLAPRGERIMALLSIAGWLTFFVKFAII